MNRTSGAFHFALLFAAIVFPMIPAAHAAQTDPAHDPNFLILPDGRDLRKVSVAGTPLGLVGGSGYSFGSAQRSRYLQLKQESQSRDKYPIQWAVVNLRTGDILDESRTPEFRIFGASVAKVFVGGTVLDKQGGKLSDAQLQLMSDMIVVSSNEAWMELQHEAGDGDNYLGQRAIQSFTQRMGYPTTRAWSGYMGDLHGNELPAHEVANYLHDLYAGNFPGATALWKIMHTCRTGGNTGRKYLPSTEYFGGKTGTYAGPTTNPETGSETNPDGSPYTVDVNHHILVFHHAGTPYGIVVFTNVGDPEAAAVMAGGLYRDYVLKAL